MWSLLIACVCGEKKIDMFWHVDLFRSDGSLLYRTQARANRWSMLPELGALSSAACWSLTHFPRPAKTAVTMLSCSHVVARS